MKDANKPAMTRRRFLTATGTVVSGLVATAHPAVEATLFHQPDRSRYVLSLVNFQHDLPNVPVDNMAIRLRLPQRVQSVRALPSGRTLRLRRDGDGVSFTVPRLNTLLMLAVNHA